MSRQPLVNVLLSTYNGEKYIQQQLDSLFAQTYTNMTIYIRDDGSTDNTLSLIFPYLSRKEKKVILLENESNQNIGYMKSFWLLLKESGEADYYAFCDQDDVWLPTKVEAGVLGLSKKNPSIPLLFSSSFEYCDENLNFIGKAPALFTPVQLKDVLFYTPAFGFTILFNHALRNIALSTLDLDAIPHDGWCQKIAAAFGEFVYDPTPRAKYRRSSSSVTHAGSDKFHYIIKWLQNDIFGNGLEDYYFVITHFYKTYGKYLNSENKKLLSLFTQQPFSLSLYMNRLLYPKRLRPSWGGELALRLCFLFNK